MPRSTEREKKGRSLGVKELHDGERVRLRLQRAKYEKKKSARATKARLVMEKDRERWKTRLRESVKE